MRDAVWQKPVLVCSVAYLLATIFFMVGFSKILTPGEGVDFQWVGFLEIVLGALLFVYPRASWLWFVLGGLMASWAGYSTVQLVQERPCGCMGAYSLLLPWLPLLVDLSFVGFSILFMNKARIKVFLFFFVFLFSTSLLFSLFFIDK